MPSTEVKPIVRTDNEHDEPETSTPVLKQARPSSLAPWQWMERVQDELSGWWQHSSLPTPFSNLTASGDPVWAPSVDMREGPKSWTIEADLPGVEKDDVEVQIRGRRLLIRAEMRQVNVDKDDKYYRRERRYGRFERVLPLPEDVDEDAITCNFDKGVLTCWLPKTFEAIQSARTVHIEGKV